MIVWTLVTLSFKLELSLFTVLCIYMLVSSFNLNLLQAVHFLLLSSCTAVSHLNSQVYVDSDIPTRF